tara:strand:+ start:91 stop:282 length:192 start_codon:yes stop_codon:yes gene_type:complete
MKNKIENKIIRAIYTSRAKNNSYWMKLLDIALKYSPNETKKILKKINSTDKKISFLIKKLTKK